MPTPVATFWSGARMPALDQACLSSFASDGHDIVVYSFEEFDGLPPGIARRDAREITQVSDLGAFLYKGVPNTSHFTDYFRYKMFQHTDSTWIDTDLVALRDWPAAETDTLLARETEVGLCGAIMRLDPKAPYFPRLLEQTERLKNTDLVWGATGPRLLTKLIGRETVVRNSYPPSKFFPIHFDAFWKPFLPEMRQECEQLCSEAYTLHLWNNIVVNLGYWKELAPPKDSYLWSIFASKNLLHLFRDEYPADVMKRMVTNWHYRKSGGDIGIIKVAKQFIPSIGRTVGPRLRAIRQLR